MAILGIDEVGRGPWAGPLVVGAVVLPDRYSQKEKTNREAWQDELTDSKKLTRKKREKLAPIILERSIAAGIGWVSAKELDEIGLSGALILATRRALFELMNCHQLQKNIISTTYKADQPDSLNIAESHLPFDEIIIDGINNFLKNTPLEELVSVLPKADSKIKAVSAASIIAKVARDNYMVKISETYPEYGFEKHVGYGTALHRIALEKNGPCAEHRFSFKPISEKVKKESKTTRDVVNISTKTIGQHAEKIVADYLEKNGHKILARNFKTKYYEIDIVSATADHIYFTEVKYRKNNLHGAPLDYIDSKKQKQIFFAAECFMKYLSKKLNRPLSEIPSPQLAAAAVVGEDFELAKWLPIVI